MYMVCHPEAREKLAEQQFLFDIVGVDRKGLIRSAFLISQASGEGQLKVLHFDSFWFSNGGDGVVLLPRFHRTRYPVALGSATAEQVLHRMMKSGYEEYQRGLAPSAGDRADWEAMVREASRVIEHEHLCSN